MGKLLKFESSSLLKHLSGEQILDLAAEARELRSQGLVIPEGVWALSLAWVIREYNVLRKENKHILDEILPALPREIELGSNAEEEHFSEESVAGQ